MPTHMHSLPAGRRRRCSTATRPTTGPQGLPATAQRSTAPTFMSRNSTPSSGSLVRSAIVASAMVRWSGGRLEISSWREGRGRAGGAGRAGEGRLQEEKGRHCLGACKPRQAHSCPPAHTRLPPQHRPTPRAALRNQGSRPRPRIPHSTPQGRTMRQRMVIFSRSRRSCATSAGCAFSIEAYLVHSSS